MSDNYKRIITIFWIFIAIILWYQVQNHVILEEAILITLCMFLSIFLINILLSNRLLPKAIINKRMNVFWGQFVLLILIQASIMSLVLLTFRQFEGMGFFPSSNLFSEGDSFLSDLKKQIPASIIINLAFVGLGFYHEHIKLEKAHLESQLHSLQAQINPHFMFNVLNHINYFVKQKDDLASTLLLNYSDILRYQLYSGKQENVSLEEEIQFLKKFIEIEKVRWDDKISIDCIWEIEDSKKRLPSLLLMPLVENAFKHVSRLPKKKGYIRLVFIQKDNLINLEVENSKSSIPCKKESHSGLGLKNLKNRLNILYHNKYSLLIQETDTIYNSKLLIQI